MSVTEFSSQYPDSIRVHLAEIARRLTAGRAAIMVGSGFSKNALTTSTIQFPDWQELGDQLFERLHGHKPKDTDQYLNPLKLASEFESAFGRAALDNAIRKWIPDEQCDFSDLHVKLLELPWADVFTTNYDTLLERATLKANSRKYDVVVSREDLPFAQKPRIIKLHGSFPSQRPFVITEEDYRKYPSESACFVNTVQQSLLENALCLVGFSGDDPNFLNWIGWIRDNLGHVYFPTTDQVHLLKKSLTLFTQWN